MGGVWKKHLELSVRHVKLEMLTALTSKGKCEVGSVIFEPGVQARGQR